MTESQERFVRAILERLPASRVVELHLFPALRQGGAETGVAVIAGRRAGVEAAAAGAEAAGSLAAGSVDAEVAIEGRHRDGSLAEGSLADGSPADGGVADGGAADGTAEEAAGRAGGPPPDFQSTGETADDRHHPVAARTTPAHDDAAPTEDAAVAEETSGASARPLARRGRRPVRPARRVAHDPGELHTVFTARYRLTLRGPDRGKWEFDLVEEADAPLVTVDAVVRGVQERAGEEGEPERLGPEALAALAAGPGAPWTTTAR